MKKQKTSGKVSQKSDTKSSEEAKKPKNLFDHLNQIRTTKDPNYYESLTESERKGFNHWAILHGLSQDISEKNVDYVKLISSLWRDGYYDKIPSPQFYRLLIELIPPTNQRLFWTKKLEKSNQKLLNYVAEWYKISTREAGEYVKIFLSSDDGLNELGWILTGLGLTDKEAENMILGENEDE